MSLTVTYNGVDIIDTSTDGTHTLLTNGKRCNDDIEIAYSGGDPWQKFDDFFGATGTTSVTGGMKYIKKDYISFIPVGANSGSRQLAYAALEFFSCKAVHPLWIYVEVQTFRAATLMKYCRIPPTITLLMGNSFISTQMLKSLVLTTNNVVALQNTNAFLGGSGISAGTGYVYVPDNLKASYQSASNWATYATQIKGYGDAPTYDATATYNIGDVCKYNSKFYGYCKSDLTSSTGNAPTGTTSDNDYWEYVGDIV